MGQPYSSLAQEGINFSIRHIELYRTSVLEQFNKLIKNKSVLIQPRTRSRKPFTLIAVLCRDVRYRGAAAHANVLLLWSPAGLDARTPLAVVLVPRPDDNLLLL